MSARMLYEAHVISIGLENIIYSAFCFDSYGLYHVENGGVTELTIEDANGDVLISTYGNRLDIHAEYKSVQKDPEATILIPLNEAVLSRVKP